MTSTDIHNAETRATAARERFMRTLHELQHRLSPKTLAADVSETVRERASDAAGRSIAVVRAKPAISAAVVAPLVAFLFRKPIARGLDRLFNRKSSTPEEQPPSPPADQGAS